eukprot:403366426
MDEQLSPLHGNKLSKQLSFNENDSARALPLVQFDSHTQKFEINPQAVEIITQKFARGPLKIISVIGLYRTGKSFLLNQLVNQQSPSQIAVDAYNSNAQSPLSPSKQLNQFKRQSKVQSPITSSSLNNGFQTCDTINSCTKGLWMWSEPVQTLATDGSSEQVLLIDTEGLGSLEEDQNHDAKIFALALMISSLIVYNSVGSIDDEAIQRLGLVIKLSKYVDLDEIQQTPRLLWLLRDFTLQLQNENKEEINANQYLQMALKDQKGISETIMNKNRIKQLIKEYFGNKTDCHTMIKPFVEGTQNQLIRKDFKEQLDAFKTQLKRSEPSQIMKTGKIFISLLQECCEALNGGRFPRLKSTWDYIVQEENQRLYTETILKFQDEVLKLNDIQQQHDQTTVKINKDELIDEFFAKSYGLDDLVQIKYYERQLRNEFSKIKNECKAAQKQQQVQQIMSRWQSSTHIFEKQAREEFLNQTITEIAPQIQAFMLKELKISKLDSQSNIVNEMWQIITKLKDRSLKEKDQLSQLLTQQLQQQREDTQLFQQQIRNLKEQLFQKEKDQAVLNQKIEFQTLELEERKREKQQYSDMQEKLIQNLQHNNQQETPSKYKLELETQRHSEALRMQQQEHDFMRKIRDLEQINDDLKHEINLKNETIKHFESQHKDGLSLTKRDQTDLQKSRDTLLEKVKELEKKNYDILVERESKIEKLRQEKEHEIQEKERQFQKEIDAIREKAESSLNQLKQFYVVEKQSIEQKLMDEKMKNHKRVSSYENEMMSKIKQEQQQKDEVLGWLELEMKDQEYEQNAKINNLEQEQLLNQQKIGTLERCLNETKQNLNQIYSFNSELITQQMDRFNHERGSMLERLERLQNEVREKERDFITSESQKQRLVEQLALIQKEYHVFKQKISINEENQKIMREDFDEEVSQYKYKISELQKQLEILHDKYKLLENYCEGDLKESINRLKQDHQSEMEARKLKTKEWKNKYEAVIQKQNEERLKAKPEIQVSRIFQDQENIQLPNGMTPQQIFQATQDEKSYIPEHIYIKIRNVDKNKDGQITKYEFEIHDNQSANKYVITRSAYQIFGLLQRISEIFDEQQLGDLSELKKMLLGQTDKYCSEEVRKLSLQHYLNEIYRDTEKVSQSSELKAFLQLHKFCGLKSVNQLQSQSSGHINVAGQTKNFISQASTQDLIQALGIQTQSMQGNRLQVQQSMQNSLGEIGHGLSESQSSVSKISLANSQSQYMTFESMGGFVQPNQMNIHGQNSIQNQNFQNTMNVNNSMAYGNSTTTNRRYEQNIQTNVQPTKIDYQELDRLLSSKNTQNLFS